MQMLDKISEKLEIKLFRLCFILLFYYIIIINYYYYHQYYCNHEINNFWIKPTANQVNKFTEQVNNITWLEQIAIIELT